MFSIYFFLLLLKELNSIVIQYVSNTVVTTFAGTKLNGNVSGVFVSPFGLCMSPSEDYIYIMDIGTNQAHKIELSNATITQIATGKLCSLLVTQTFNCITLFT